MSEPNVTIDAQVMPSALADGEQYATVRDILECDDLPQATIHIPHWRINGRPAAVRVRGLSLEERERVQSVDGVAEQYCLIWHYGCVAPTFTREQAEALRRKNPHAVEAGAQFMLILSSINQDWIAHAVELATNAAPARSDDDAGSADDSAPVERSRRMGRPPGRPVPHAARGNRPDA